MKKKIVIVVGATGALGMEIVKAMFARGASVRAMVRPTSNRSKLEKLGVTDFVAGDMMDPASLNLALAAGPGADAVIASAAGYTGHTECDKAAEVPHFYHKHLVEKYLAKAFSIRA